MGKKTLRSPHSRPTLCHGVPRIFLTAPLAYDAVAFHLGQCEKRLRYGKLATSSILKIHDPGIQYEPAAERALRNPVVGRKNY